MEIDYNMYVEVIPTNMEIDYCVSKQTPNELQNFDLNYQDFLGTLKIYTDKHQNPEIYNLNERIHNYYNAVHKYESKTMLNRMSNSLFQGIRNILGDIYRDRYEIQYSLSIMDFWENYLTQLHENIRTIRKAGY